MSFIHLDTFSAYSLLESTITPEQLAVEAKKRGYRSVALTDKNVLYGAIPFYKACLNEGVKPIIGLTADVLLEDDSGKSFPFIFLAKSSVGYENLMKISSAIQTKSPKGIPVKWLAHYRKDLFVISPGGNGEIEQLLMDGKGEQALERIRFYESLFEEGAFFLSIRRGNDGKWEILLEKIIELSKATGVPVVPTTAVRFLNKEDYPAWKCLLAIKENVLLDEIEVEPSAKDNFLRPVEEMEKIYEDFPDALNNLKRIEEECDIRFSFHQRLLPKYPLPDGNADDYLTQLCEKGLHERVEAPSDTYWKRLAYELDIIKRMNFSDYFLIVWDFVRYAKENGIIVGPGRGSAAGSLVAFVLGITDVDPIKYQLLFERFLNPERVTMPDIDIDFPDHRRDEIIHYVVKKYGQSHVAQIITFGTFAAKAALRDVARMYGLSGDELSQLSKAVPSKLGITLDGALRESEVLKRLSEQEKFRQIFRIAKKIEGLPRHTSTHAAGVIISDRPLIETVPLQQGSTDVLLTQYPMGILEELGLLKMDFLGLRNLSLMEEILSEIRKRERKSVQLAAIPFDDERTFHLLQEGRTTGIFQLESEGMRNVLKRLKPTEFEDIVAVNALYRPGPMSNIPLYIRRKHGEEPVRYPHPDLENLLKKTYGVIVYQEQIMQVASRMAGFTLGEADLLRRAVSKKKREILDRERAHFVAGAVKKGYTEDVANGIYDLIVHFADYGFNRSHAVAYSMISYQLAYLKTHYPLYFLAALLTSVIGNEEKIAEYIKELRQLGYSVKGPSINKSHYRFQVEDGGIRFSLAAIKGVGIQALKEIFRARKVRPFKDLFDFCLRVPLKTVNRKTMEQLIHSGSFDEFGQDRAVLLATLDAAVEHAQLMKPEDEQMNLITDDTFGFRPKYANVDPIPIDVKLQYEKQVLGMFLSKHPASLYRKVFYYHQCKYLGDLPLEERGSKVVVYVADVRKIRTKNGEAMAFLQISDETEELAGVVFPNVYKKINPLLKKDEILLVTGHLEIRNRQRQLIVREAEPVGKWIEQAEKARLFLRISPKSQRAEKLMEMKRILQAHRGDTPVILFYERDQRTVQLSEDYRIDLESEGVQKLKGLLGNVNVVVK